MKKWISRILALSLILCAVALPGTAENETQTDTVTSASVSQGRKDSRKDIPGGQMPEGRRHGRKDQQPDSTRTQPEESESVPDFIPDDPEGMPDFIPDDPDGKTVSPAETPEAGQPPEITDGESTSGLRKGKGPRDLRTGKKKTESTDISGQITFELLLEKGVISQEVYDAIMNFIKEYTAALTDTVPEAPAAGDVSDS